MSQKWKQKASAVAASLRRGVPCAILTALPLCAFIFFFETTRPASVSSAVLLVSRSLNASEQGGVWRHSGFVSRFRDVSAQLGRGATSDQIPQILVAKNRSADAADASSIGLDVGFEAEFVTRDGHRKWLRILSRNLIVDQVIPDNGRLMEIAPASSADIITFAWGRWIYRAQVEDRGFESETMVQKVL